MEEVERKILGLFIDNSNRPKKTPRHESLILILLEKEYSAGKIQNSLKHLEELRTISSIKKEIRDVGEARFFFATKLDSEFIQNKIPRKINTAAGLIAKYSDIKITKMLGEHLHSLVKYELRSHGFAIIDENTRTYSGRIWNKTRHTLDIIAKHKEKNLEIGVEIKNTLTLPPKSEITTKINMCKELGVKPLFACRWLDPYKNDIEMNGGFVWQFYDQIYPLGHDKFVQEIRKRFQLPIRIASELPTTSVLDFEKWLTKFV